MTKGKCALMGRKEWQQKTKDKEGFLLQPRCSPTGKAEMEAKQRHLGLIPLGNWGGSTMCSETGSRYTGLLLLALAIAAIIANLLLYFPSGQVLEPAKITDFVWFFHGFLGAGLLMLFPVLLAIQGTVGAVYCVVISSLGLLSGPLCDTGSGNYTYPFRNYSLENSYLLNQPTWANCQEPEHIVLWNVVLFSILLGIGVVEAVLCLSQVVSGLCDIFCGTCVRKGQLILRSKKRDNAILRMRNSGSERFSYLSEVSKPKF
nr:transmembrane 4 L6 family member 1-like [Globicephala melas]